MVSGAAGHSICALIALVLQVACGSVLADGLAGSEWTPVQLAGHPVEEAAGLYVRFGLEGRVTGYGGCNHFVGACQVTDGQISIGPLGATRMACPEPVMRLERVFLQALEQARGFSRDGPGLVLDDAQGNAVAGFRQADWD